MQNTLVTLYAGLSADIVAYTDRLKLAAEKSDGWKCALYVRNSGKLYEFGYLEEGSHVSFDATERGSRRLGDRSEALKQEMLNNRAAAIAAGRAFGLSLLGTSASAPAPAPIVEYVQVVDPAAQELAAQLAAEVERLNAELAAAKAAQTVGGKTTHPIMPYALGFLRQRINVYLNGEAGTGKTTLAAHLADALGTPFGFCGRVYDAVELTGYRDMAGKLVRTTFREIWEFGGLFCWDEFDRSDSGAIAAFHAAMDNGVMAFPDGLVKRHPNCYLIATGNTNLGGADTRYVAANQLDGATRDRWRGITVDYAPNVETAMAKGDTLLADFNRDLRETVNRCGLDHIVGTRGMRDFATMRHAETDRSVFPEDKLFADCFFGLWARDDVRTVSRNLADQNNTYASYMLKLAA